MSLTAPSGYRHYISIPIRFNDLDALGHVNNAIYLTFMESARIAYLRELGLWLAVGERFGPIMAKATVDYRSALVLADEQAHIYSRCSRLGNKSFEMEHLILRASDGATAAYGVIVGVAYDYVENQSIPIPDEWRVKIVQYEPTLSDSG